MGLEGGDTPTREATEAGTAGGAIAISEGATFDKTGCSGKFSKSFSYMYLPFFYLPPVVGKVTVTPLQSYITSYFLE
jgi:hypothetical protein